MVYNKNKVFWLLCSSVIWKASEEADVKVAGSSFGRILNLRAVAPGSLPSRTNTQGVK